MQKIKLRGDTPLREDGKETRQRIIECAGKLIAQHGYAKTTSKAICQLAGVNMAAVNYHFGSRDGLYLAVMEEVHAYLMNLDELNRIAHSNISSRDKLERFFDFYVTTAYAQRNWHVTAWAREILNPPNFIDQVISRNALPKLAVVAGIFSEYTGLSKDDMRLYTCLLSTMAPFALLFLARNNSIDYDRLLPISYPLEDVVTQLKRYAFAGLDAFKIKRV